VFKRDELGEVLDGHTLRFVRTLNHSCERVWRAITDESEISAWMRYPVKFEPRAGGRAQFFGDGAERLDGKVFVFEPPYTLAFSFFGPTVPEQVVVGECEWSVRYELKPEGDGCRLTFTHRLQPGAVLWGVGEGWHLFIDQLRAYLDGTLDAIPSYAGEQSDAEGSGAREYRAHITEQLLAWGEHAASAAREAIAAGRADDARARVDEVALALRQVGRIAIQPGVRPDYSLEGATTLDL
jgi:uncharacterized protein YndB with AHSA1/START domain